MNLLPKLACSLTLLLLVASPTRLLAFDAKLARQCFADICGNESNYLATSARGPFGETAPADVTIFENKFIKARIDQIVDGQASNASDSIKLGSELLAKTKEDPLSTQQLTTVLISNAMTQFQKEIISATSSSKTPGTQIDGHLLAFEIVSLPQETVEKIATVLNAFHKQKAYQVISEIRGTSLFVLRYAVTRGAKSADEIDAVWSKNVDEIISDARSNLKNISSTLYDNLDLKLLEKAKDLSKMTPFEQNSAMTLIVRIEYAFAMTKDEVIQTFQQTGLTQQDVFEIGDWTNRSSKTAEVLRNDGLRVASKTVLEQRCLPVVTQSIAASQSSFRIGKLTTLLDEVKSAAKEAAKTYFTGESLLAAQESIDGTQFVFPSNSRNIRSQILQSFDDTLRHQRLYRTNVLTADLSATHWKDVLVKILTWLPKEPGALLISDASNVCSDLSPPSFEDKTLPERRIIQVGWQSVAFPELGAGIVSHEIGHVVSKAIADVGLNSTSAAFQSTRQCSDVNHQNLLPFGIMVKSQQFAEEDWADAFSVATMRTLKSKWPFAKSNMACALVRIGENKLYGAFDLILEGASDPHSTGAYRVLQTEANFGRSLPPSCKAAYTAAQVNASTHACGK